jgi:hypothetical protein
LRDSLREERKPSAIDFSRLLSMEAVA